MKSMVIGRGQIGSALKEIFSKAHECFIRDVMIEPDDPGEVDVLHIAYPYNENFIDHTRHYIEYYRPELTIIHSSVAVGTSNKCGDNVVHSPERGRFPNLAKEMLYFPKFVGGGDNDDRNLAKTYMEMCGWEVVQVDDSRWTEAVKLISNIHLGLEVAWRQEVGRMFESLGLEGQAVYNFWEDSYNVGHAKLGHKHLIRPIVRPDPIGGHCILPCMEIMDSQVKSPAFQFIKDSNEKRKQEIKRTHSSPREAVGF